MSAELAVRASRSVHELLQNALIGPEAAQDTGVTLSVRFPDREVNVRELGAYLLLIDRFYARLVSRSIYRYAHRRTEQLSVTEIRPGSCQLLLREEIKRGRRSTLAPLYLLLRYLPELARANPQGTDQVHLEQHEALWTVRRIRKRLRAAVPSEPLLESLDPKAYERIIAFLQQTYMAEEAHLPPAIRFSRSYVHEVSLQVVRSAPPRDLYPLRGLVLRFDQPTAPVAEGEWSVLA